MWEKNVTCDVGIAQCENGTVKCKKKVREQPNVRKKMITCDVGTTQCEDGTVKCEKKVRNRQVWEKSKEPPNVTKELSYVMLEPHNMRMESSNMRKKK